MTQTAIGPYRGRYGTFDVATPVDPQADDWPLGQLGNSLRGVDFTAAGGVRIADARRATLFSRAGGYLGHAFAGTYPEPASDWPIFVTKPATDPTGNFWIGREDTRNPYEDPPADPSFPGRQPSGASHRLAHYGAGGGLIGEYLLPSGLIAPSDPAYDSQGLSAILDLLYVPARDQIGVYWTSRDGNLWCTYVALDGTPVASISIGSPSYDSSGFKGDMTVDIDGTTIVSAEITAVHRRSSSTYATLSTLARPYTGAGVATISACAGPDDWTYVADNRSTTYRIKAGDVFTYTTTDPEVSDSHPVWVPSWTRPARGTGDLQFWEPWRIRRNHANGDVVVCDRAFAGVRVFGDALTRRRHRGFDFSRRRRR